MDVLSNKVHVKPRHALNARELAQLQPFYAYLRQCPDIINYAIPMRCLEISFNFLEEEVGEDDVAIMLRLSLCCSPGDYWNFLHRRTDSIWYWVEPPDWHTPAQFDMLADYLVLVCDNTDYDAIADAFWVLAGLRGSPSTLKQKRIYIEKIIHIMGQNISDVARHAAIHAACIIRRDVALLGQDDGLLRYRLSQALTSLAVDIFPFQGLAFGKRHMITCYLKLLCTLIQEPMWHYQLQRSGYFNNCLAIAERIPFMDPLLRHIYGPHAVHVSHIYAIIDELSEESPFLQIVQAHSNWRLILSTWDYIFSYDFFEVATKDSWTRIAGTDYLEILPSLVTYAQRNWEQWDNRAETFELIGLVGQVCERLDEETHRSTQESTPSGQGSYVSLRHQGIPELGKQIHRKLLFI